MGELERAVDELKKKYTSVEYLHSEIAFKSPVTEKEDFPEKLKKLHRNGWDIEYDRIVIYDGIE